MAVTAQTLLTYLEKSGVKLSVVNGSLVVSTNSTRQPNAKEQAEINSFSSELISIIQTRTASNVLGRPEGITYGVTGAPSRFQRETEQSVYNIVNTWNGQTGDVTFYDYVSSFNGHTGAVHGVSTWNGQTGDVIYVDQNENTGILFGGGITAAVGSTAFTVHAGAGQIVGYTNGMGGATATITAVTWDDFTGITLANLTASDFTRVYIDSSGNLQQQIAVFDHTDPLDKIIIGTISHIDRASITLVTNKQITAYDFHHKVYELYDTFGPMKKTGLIVSANGANLSLNRSDGEALILGSNYLNSYEEPDTVEITAETAADIARIYRDGSGDFVYDTNSLSFYSVVDPGYYDDNSGTLQVVNNNQYTVQRMFMFPNLQNVIMLYYGRVIYNSYSDALAGIQDEVFTEADITSKNAVFLGWLIVRGGAADLTDPVDGKIIQAGFSRNSAGGAGGGGGTNIYAGAGLTLGGGSTMSIDQTAVIHAAGISLDAGGITFPDGTHQNTAATTPTIKHVAGFLFDGRGSTLSSGLKSTVVRPVEDNATITHFSIRSYDAVASAVTGNIYAVSESYIGVSGASFGTDGVTLGSIGLTGGEYGKTGGTITVSGITAGDLLFCGLEGAGWSGSVQIFVHYGV
jgi:hypothetical protein